MVTHVGDGCTCFCGSDTPAYQTFLGTLYMSEHGIRNRNQAILEETITGSTISPALTENFDTNMLTRDLFAVANFLVINSNNTSNSGITPIKRDELSKCKMDGLYASDFDILWAWFSNYKLFNKF